MDVAHGESGLWVKTLPRDVLEAARDAFRARNMNAESIRVNPYAGYVEYAELPTASSEQPLTTWGGDELQRRLLTPFWRNTDLMDLTERELRDLVWTWPSPRECAEGNGRRSRPESAHMGPLAGKLKLRVCFDQGGTVRSFELAVWGPPVPMHAVPARSRDEALAALIRQGYLFARRFSLSLAAERLEPGTPELVLFGDRRDDWRGEPELVGNRRNNHEPKLVTWRLAWAVPIYHGAHIMYVDAKGGELFAAIQVLYR